MDTFSGSQLHKSKGNKDYTIYCEIYMQIFWRALAYFLMQDRFAYFGIKALGDNFKIECNDGSLANKIIS